ncbi:stage III sporulation protein AF [Bacillus sp. DNRA2]|uniref:stage III sporulation protein AF n=1 Tax=Bacillus sp. DNRA2 TaxID=2723053 RepID=UPI00145F503F|nr:stage III sporulation protein AF [Bacillus sp. DNRA2]NMD70187.1 stage III sporulation protein AF [Bacillus sp. DNRA2]
MDFLKEWITNIILFVLLATVIDMLLPNSTLQKYTKMVTGLLLIAVILTPIFKLISGDFEKQLATISLRGNDETKNMESLIESKKKEIQTSQQAYILETMAVQLEKDANEELMEKHGLNISNIKFVINEDQMQNFPDNLEKVIVQLEEPKISADAVEVVKPVEISANEPLPSERENEHEKPEIVSFLSQKWDIDERTIEVEMVEGGKSDHNG